MKAAIVHSFDSPPRYGSIEAPVAIEGEVLVQVRAAALSQLVRAQANGSHYSSGKNLPVVPGADGIATLADGRRVYFAFPRAPIGAMAEIVAVKTDCCVIVPDSLDDVTAAAIALPGMSSWAALQERARFRAGERVLINGAAGTSGRLAIQVAKFLGASRVVATARNPAMETELHALGADSFISLDQPADKLTAALRDEFERNGIDIVLDYLWGSPAACIINAVGTHGHREASPRVRFVNIGMLAGTSIPLNPGTLRSSGLELLGSGLGSVSPQKIVQVVGKLMHAIEPAGLQVDAEAVALTNVETTWQRPSSERIVFTI
ncbi:zinc-binding alcohol dehydrogenase family protein [Comamonas sp. A23]|nr:Alcohol dehydrogenase, zinc-binding protein [Comamonas thiooxydans]TFF63340.1 zinc-binding alcohol dehydrogenase family protein [Comamonas sp. A23]